MMISATLPLKRKNFQKILADFFQEIWRGRHRLVPPAPWSLTART